MGSTGPWSTTPPPLSSFTGPPPRWPTSPTWTPTPMSLPSTPTTTPWLMIIPPATLMLPRVVKTILPLVNTVSHFQTVVFKQLPTLLMVVTATSLMSSTPERLSTPQLLLQVI